MVSEGLERSRTHTEAAGENQVDYGAWAVCNSRKKSTRKLTIIASDPFIIEVKSAMAYS